MGDHNNEEDEGIIWESSQPSSSAATDETRRRSDDDPLSLSLPTQKIEQFLCTSPTRVIPAMTASDISRNMNSQNLFFDDVEIDPSQNQIILEDEEFLFNLPQEAATSSVQLADALYDRITTDDQFNDSKVYDTLTNISTPLRPYSAATSSSENIAMKSSTEPSPVMSTNLNYSYDYAGGAVQGRNFNSAQSTKQDEAQTCSTKSANNDSEHTTNDYGLKISVEAASKRKTSDYVYQSADRMLFSRPFVYIPFIMELKRIPPADAVLQIMACYSRHEHSMVAVKRCAHHLSTDDTIIREHFIQCEHQSAVYVNCATPNDPSFIILPLNELFSSLSPLFIPLKFTCFSSCTGGINRRAVHISFVLKSNEQIIGSDVISLKVCACPSRDATLEGYEPRPKKRRTVLSKRPTEVITKTICTESEKKDVTDRFREDEDTIYEVQVRGRHLYKLVCSIIANYELSRRYLKEKNGLNDSDDKLDTLKSPSTPLTNRTAIKTWLANLDLSKYEGAFTSKCLFVIDDLEGVINRKFLLSIGVKEEEIGLILESYLSWYDVYNAQRQSSLSSHSSTIRIQRTRVRSSTLHLD